MTDLQTVLPPPANNVIDNVDGDDDDGSSTIATKQFSILALYKFLRRGKSQGPLDLPELKTELLEMASKFELKGTLLIANEGINGTVCMPKEHAAEVELFFGNHELYSGIRMRWSNHTGKDAVFHRMFVKIKKEIVSMGVHLETMTAGGGEVHEQDCDDGNPGHPLAGDYISANNWDDFFKKNPDVDLIDCRNSYEVGMGTFTGAIDPGTDSFTQLPSWLENFGHCNERSKPKKIAMFCTGGIRCEKATALAKLMKHKESGEPLFQNVYHLEGGILSYLDKVGSTNEVVDSNSSRDHLKKSSFIGECFVFDQRVSVGSGLKRGTYTLCHGCRAPLSKDNVHHPTFIRGVQCKDCCNISVDESSASGTKRQLSSSDKKHMERQIERQRQFEISQEKGERWGDTCKNFALDAENKWRSIMCKSKIDKS